MSQSKKDRLLATWHVLVLTHDIGKRNGYFETYVKMHTNEKATAATVAE